MIGGRHLRRCAGATEEAYRRMSICHCEERSDKAMSLSWVETQRRLAQTLASDGDTSAFCAVNSSHGDRDDDEQAAAGNERAADPLGGKAAVR